MTQIRRCSAADAPQSKIEKECQRSVNMLLLADSGGEQVIFSVGRRAILLLFLFILLVFSAGMGCFCVLLNFLLVERL